MTALYVVLVLGALWLFAGVVALRAGEQRRWRRELAAFALRFPRGTDPAAVATFIGGLAGLAAPAWQRPYAARAVVFEVTATAEGITHHLLVPRPLVPVVTSALRAALPNVAVAEDPDHRLTRATVAGEVGLSSEWRPLRTDAPEAASAALLAAMQPLVAGERLVLQWAISPTGPVALLPEKQRDAGARRDLRAKRATPLFLAAGRLGAVASDRARAKLLFGRLTAALHTLNAPGAHLYRRRVPSRWAARALAGPRLPLLRRPCLLNAAELAALVAFPVGELSLPGLTLGGCRQLAPAADIPRSGRVVAEATFPGAQRPLALSVAESLRHLHVIGPTGTGKSTLLTGLIAQDMAAGYGVVVIDPKADLITAVLDRVPAGRVGDVILLDPSDAARPVGLNLLAGADTAPELVVDQVAGTLQDLFRAFWGPRTDDILRAALLTLVQEPGATLAEVPLLLTDPGFRRRLVGRIDDPVALGPFWGWYETMSDAERAAAIGPVMNKLRAILLRERIRHIVGQSRPPFDLARAVAEGRIILLALSKGLLGEEAAALLGSLFIARLWQVVQGRAAVPPPLRRPLFVYVDEVADFLHLPTSLDDVLAQARGLGVGLTLAHQHLGQLPPALRSGLLANARSRVIFQPSAEDARALARELAPYLTATDLQGLGAYEVVATLSAGARVAPPVTGRTLPPPPSTGQAQAVRSSSRARYGADREAVAAAIRARHEGGTGRGRVGRREVTP